MSRVSVASRHLDDFLTGMPHSSEYSGAARPIDLVATSQNPGGDGALRLSFWWVRRVRAY
jgi:hypothetical protein